ncbi:4218_t:CDS:2 [Entrophospora sp. SA101]|nr:4218_t:CDS:2 [Entrophospora sp. SA101]
MDDNRILKNVVFSVRDPAPEHIIKAIAHKVLSKRRTRHLSSEEEEGEYVSSNNNEHDDDKGSLLNDDNSGDNDILNEVIMDDEDDGEIIPFQSQIYIGNRRYKEQSSPPFNKRVRGLSTSNGMYYDSGRTRDDQYSYYHRNDYHPVPPPYIDHHIPYGRGLLNNNNNMSRRSSNAPPPLQSGRSTIPRPSDRLRNRY